MHTALEEQHAIDGESRQVLSAFFRHTSYFITHGLKSMSADSSRPPPPPVVAPASGLQEAELGRQRRVRRQQIAAATAATEAAFSPLEHVDSSWCEAAGGSEPKEREMESTMMMGRRCRLIGRC